MRDDLKNSDSHESLTSASLCSTALRRLHHNNRQVEATHKFPFRNIMPLGDWTVSTFLWVVADFFLLQK